ncbi:MAG: ASKHA domain-containing protein [Syntrophobacteraceae bacterium]
MSQEQPPFERPGAMVEIVRLELPPPDLKDNTGDFDRLARALEKRGYFPLRVEYSLLDGAVRRIRSQGYRLAAVLGYDRFCWKLLEVLLPEYAGPVLGVAVDLGTTGISFQLVDFNGRETPDRMSVPNPQIRLGEDILTRILHARGKENLLELQRLLIEIFNRTIREMLDRRGWDPGCVYALAVAGNTAMSHFFLGLDPSGICKEPYIPSANRFPVCRGAELGLIVHPEALVTVFPNVGAYFGGDLIAGILASGMNRSEHVQILVDVGTNAEVVLGNRDWMLACAGAAGPALEGGAIERGMMALPGAIDRVRIDPSTLEPSWHVLGEGKPAGICGSGVVDLVAEMFAAGILTVQGKIDLSAGAPGIIETPECRAYELVRPEESADGRGIAVSEIDIGIFLKSKAAMYTILSVMIRKVGLDFGDIERFFVAGTFGNHIDPGMAVRIGMLPDLPLETYCGLGNSSLRGAEMLLRDRSLAEETERVCRLITYVELNVSAELLNEFSGALFLPHTDPRLFPSVKPYAGRRTNG